MDDRKREFVLCNTSRMLEMAMEDLRQAEASRNYIVDMNTWYDTRGKNGKCVVCLAGSVLACSLNNVMENQAEKSVLVPSMFDEIIEHRLMALNEFRLGNVYTALGFMIKGGGITLRDGIPPRVRQCYPCVRYQDAYPKPFHDAMGEIILHLREHGL